MPALNKNRSYDRRDRDPAMQAVILNLHVAVVLTVTGCGAIFQPPPTTTTTTTTTARKRKFACHWRAAGGRLALLGRNVSWWHCPDTRLPSARIATQGRSDVRIRSHAGIQ